MRRPCTTACQTRALRQGAFVAGTGHMHFRWRAVNSTQAQHQRDCARSAIAFVGRIRAVAAVALTVAALHGMERHPRAIHPVATKRQHAQARFAVLMG